MIVAIELKKTMELYCKSEAIINMSLLPPLISVLDPVHQPIVAINGNMVIYANPAAKSTFGVDVLEKKIDQILSPELLESESDSLVCAGTVCGRKAKTFITKQNDIKICYIELDEDAPEDGAIVLTRQMLSYLRSCVSGMKIAADRYFTKQEESTVPDKKLVSILYHYYYRLARSIIQLDNADKFERGEAAFSPQSFDLVSACRELVNALDTLTSDQKIKLSFNSEGERILATVDPELFELMMLNLLSNCVKSVGKNRSISLSLSKANNKIVISIDDNGGGIPAERLSSVFSLPDQAGSALRLEEGLGLGLYISQAVTRLHGGTILMESREGEGSKVRVLLPVCEETGRTFNTPESAYKTRGASTILMGFADVISSDFYGTLFED